MTATATRATAAEVATVLGLPPDAVVREQPLRDNLRLKVRAGVGWGGGVGGLHAVGLDVGVGPGARRLLRGAPVAGTWRWRLPQLEQAHW